jgi:hypothetical protein
MSDKAALHPLDPLVAGPLGLSSCLRSSWHMATNAIGPRFRSERKDMVSVDGHAALTTI